MAIERSEHLVACSDCGALNEEATETFQDLHDEINVLKSELTSKLRRIKALQREADQRLQAHPLYPNAVTVLRHWRDLCHPNAVELEGGERLRKVMARLCGKPKPYTEAQLKQCILGYSKFPFVVNGRRTTHGSPSQRYIDAELVFRDPKHVDQGIAFALEAAHRAEVIPSLSGAKESELSSLGQSAMKLARFGWSVFPVAPKGKHPVTTNGLLDATRDLDRISAFWTTHPEHNIGVRCGAESGIVVLDVDGDLGLDSLHGLETKYQPLPQTLSVVTPRGGQHFYFHHPGGDIRNTAGFPGPGLDVRGDGGYVLAPPSVGPSGRSYQVDEQVAIADLPEWLHGLLMKRQRAQKTAVNPAEWEAMVQNGITAGQRNQQLVRFTGYLWSHGLEQGVILGIVQNTNHEKCSPPLPEQEVARIVESVARMRARNQ